VVEFVAIDEQKAIVNLSDSVNDYGWVLRIVLGQIKLQRGRNALRVNGGTHIRPPLG